MFFTNGKVMFPESIRMIMEQLFLPNGKNDEERYAKSLATLWRKLALERGQTKESHYSFQAAEANAYAAYYMPINCLKAPLVLEEALLLGTSIFNEKKNVWLDVGTGPGTAYLGLQWWQKARGIPLSFIGIDQSETFLRMAEKLPQAAGNTLPAKFFSMKKKSVSDFLEELGATHLCFMNSLAEVFPDLNDREEKILSLAKVMRTMAKRDGLSRYFIFIEPASKNSSRELAQLKDKLREVGNILFPCLDNRSCGALAKVEDWCHEEVGCVFPDWIQRIGSAASMQKEALLFSYVVVEITGNTAISKNSTNFARVVSQRLERKGQTECWMCLPEGKKMVRAQKSKQNESSHHVMNANRGDIWESFSLGEKADLLSAKKKEASLSTVFSISSD